MSVASSAQAAARRASGAVLVMLCGFAAPSGAQPWQPERAIEVIAPSGPGGGTDRTARTVQRILQEQKLLPASAVVNKPGAGGAIGLAYLNQHAGDAHYVAVSTVPLLSAHITGGSAIGPRDVTPLAQLYSEYLLYAVRADSTIKCGRELVERLKSDPQSVGIGVTSIGGTSHMAAGLLARSVGADARKLKMVVFKSGGEASAALLGGHIDLVPAPVANLWNNVRSGKLRAIAISAPQRAGGELADVPTWNEQGAKHVFDTWRGMAGPRGMRREQVEFWDRTLARLTATEDWKKDLAKNRWSDNYLPSGEAVRFLDEQYREFHAVLSDLGLAKR